jgi:cell division protein FtsA
MLKNLPQLVKYKTAMDVRIGHPNVHLSGKGKDEINQPMYATSVGLIMKGLEYIEENKLVVRFGEKKQEPVLPQKPVFHTEKEVIVEQEEVMIDETPEEKPRRPQNSIVGSLRKIWGDIMDATDEKMDDDTPNN